MSIFSLWSLSMGPDCDEVVSCVTLQLSSLACLHLSTCKAELNSGKSPKKPLKVTSVEMVVLKFVVCSENVLLLAVPLLCSLLCFPSIHVFVSVLFPPSPAGVLLCQCSFPGEAGSSCVGAVSCTPTSLCGQRSPPPRDAQLPFLWDMAEEEGETDRSNGERIFILFYFMSPMGRN